MEMQKVVSELKSNQSQTGVTSISMISRLSAADIMSKHVVTAQPNDDVSRIASEMERHNIGSVIIVEKGKVVGILTERDFVQIVEQVGVLLNKSLARHHMTRSVVTVQPETTVSDIIKLMKEKHVRHVVVVTRNQEVAGVISSRDLVKVTSEAMSI
jgi:CBS domain-containing protein